MGRLLAGGPITTVAALVTAANALAAISAATITVAAASAAAAPRERGILWCEIRLKVAHFFSPRGEFPHSRRSIYFQPVTMLQVSEENLPRYFPELRR